MFHHVAEFASGMFWLIKLPPNEKLFTMPCLFKKLKSIVRIKCSKQEQAFTFVNITKTLLLRMFKLLFRNYGKS